MCKANKSIGWGGVERIYPRRQPPLPVFFPEIAPGEHQHPRNPVVFANKCCVSPALRMPANQNPLPSNVPILVQKLLPSFIRKVLNQILQQYSQTVVNAIGRRNGNQGRQINTFDNLESDFEMAGGVRTFATQGIHRPAIRITQSDHVKTQTCSQL